MLFSVPWLLRFYVDNKAITGERGEKVLNASNSSNNTVVESMGSTLVNVYYVLSLLNTDQGLFIIIWLLYLNHFVGSGFYD